ncbi:hypothetical protein AGMMS50268_17700 [Spirochaetia bacterium]|nr:hypothetical protein AGMMS50268_17700 [Spirochaetia bacterium]
MLRYTGAEKQKMFGDWQKSGRLISGIMKPLDTLSVGARQFSEKNENSRKELIAGISHDLCTSLISIKMSIDGIKSGVAETAPQREKYFDIIESKTRDIEHIIEQLFFFKTGHRRIQLP